MGLGCSMGCCHFSASLSKERISQSSCLVFSYSFFLSPPQMKQFMFCSTSYDIHIRENVAALYVKPSLRYLLSSWGWGSWDEEAPAGQHCGTLGCATVCTVCSLSRCLRAVWPCFWVSYEWGMRINYFFICHKREIE